ncbi:MAG: 30S ribosomal protein S4 [Promethearchaeota archaeon]
MGDPRKLRKHVIGPRHPYSKERLEEEIELMGVYGLRNKREIYKASTRLRRYRARARKMLALPEEIRNEQEKILVAKLYQLGILKEEKTSLDAVLSLSVQDFLNRRLQTIVRKLGLAATPYQARQFINHGHIGIKGHQIREPSYHVDRVEEELITYVPGSPLEDPDHTMRPSTSIETSVEAGDSNE